MTGAKIFQTAHILIAISAKFLEWKLFSMLNTLGFFFLISVSIVVEHSVCIAKVEISSWPFEKVKFVCKMPENIRKMNSSRIYSGIIGSSFSNHIEPLFWGLCKQNHCFYTDIKNN